jgi:hypothetical protein
VGHGGRILMRDPSLMTLILTQIAAACSAEVGAEVRGGRPG